MKPWVYTDKSGLSSIGAALTARVLGHLLWGCAAPLGLKECVSMPNPGLAPWAMNKYRPYRAPLRLPYQYTLLFTLLSVAAGATSSKFRRIMSAVGTTPLQSPGCNEGKARYETLVRTDKSRLSSAGAALTARVFVSAGLCSAFAWGI